MAYSDRELLARLIQCEAGGEGEDGMKAVAGVVMNRVHAKGGAFNENGVRLGSGAGFFDRYLTFRSRDPLPPVTVAVSFEMLRCEELQAERHDVLCDWIATEAGVRRVG